MNAKWYVLRSKPSKEMILWRELLARGLEAFFPHLRVRPVDPRNRKIRPYFPGYLFLHTDIEQLGISVIRWMPYSSGLVAFDGAPAWVPENMVQAIRRHVDELNTTRLVEKAGLQPGDPLIVRGGPFDGYEAIFDARIPGRERVRVFLTLLQRRQVNVELPLSQVELRKKRPR
jgi:transcription antitermination factor NusG